MKEFKVKTPCCISPHASPTYAVINAGAEAEEASLLAILHV